MPAISDLTFAQLNTALGTNCIIFDAATNNILISVKLLTGDTYTALTNDGVSELIYKLIKGSQTAQLTANEGRLAEEQIRSFPPATTGTFNPATNRIPVTSTIQVALNIDPNRVSGVNT